MYSYFNVNINIQPPLLPLMPPVLLFSLAFPLILLQIPVKHLDINQAEKQLAIVRYQKGRTI